MKVAIIVNFGFPGGMASTSRARHLAMGLTECGAEAEIIIPKPTELPSMVLNERLTGEMEGFSFRYTSSSTVIPANFLARRWSILLGYVRCVRHLFRNRRDISAVILYLREISGLAFLATWCRLWGIPAILEICEWPVSHKNNSLRTRFQNWLLTTGSFHFVDGVIAISSFLEQRVADFSAKHKLRRPCLVVPILVNSDNYQGSGAYNPRGDLLFCGILDQVDIVLFLLKVVSQLKEKGFSRKLIITGKAFIEQNLETIKQEITRLELSDLIVLTGYVSGEELKGLYCTASVLLAPLPSGERSVARFPNKIGEYLASGRPVVTTAIGDIPNYLTDGESAYLVQPDDVKGFAAAIMQVINDTQKAERIGSKGCEVAVRHFDPRANGERMIDLIKKIRMNMGNR